ncbi:phosphotransferase family protein [Streptomyces sp. NBC_01477]|uniref:phosphotransferase family protein n=1 Tax=Streptomyces sp. NBC_01477 TaxID=2976015 RepID=UPI002E30C265|nr:phosphotransferase family protein [Streptomyces sp. NBC_01477]
MPVPLQRDLELTRKRLTGWLSDRLPYATDLRIVVDLPQGLGFSHESLLVHADWTERGIPRLRRFVVRVAPIRYRVMPVSHLDDEYTILRALAGTDVPVPAVLGYEADPGLLGAPFYAMTHVPGWVPSDLPSYHRGGPLHDSPPAGQAAVWWSGVGVLERLHRLDPYALGLGGLRAPAGLTAQLDFYERHLDHFAGPGTGAAVEALGVLRAGLPPQPPARQLVWGDARLGNILFAGTGAAAVLDWEMAFLGPGEADLGWYLWFDRHLSEGVGATRLPGLPGRSETVARYEAGTGRPVGAHLHWYELFAGFRFALIANRVGRLIVEHGLVASEADVPLARNAARLLDRALRSPG